MVHSTDPKFVAFTASSETSLLKALETHFANMYQVVSINVVWIPAAPPYAQHYVVMEKMY